MSLLADIARLPQLPPPPRLPDRRCNRARVERLPAQPWRARAASRLSVRSRPWMPSWICSGRRRWT